MKIEHFRTSFTAAILAVAAAACTHGGRLETPSGFANLGDRGDFSYRATSARGVVLATRTETNDVNANTDFWSETLDLQLRDRGYVADGAPRPVKTAKGLQGSQLRYTTTRDGRAHRYWITVFATRSKVYVVEAAGDKVPFDAAEGTIDRAVATLDATD